MLPEKYCFEGEAIVVCSVCGKSHTLSFSGMNPCSIEEAIEEALTMERWGANGTVCTDCYEAGYADLRPDKEMDDEYMEYDEEFEEEDYD